MPVTLETAPVDARYTWGPTTTLLDIFRDRVRSRAGATAMRYRDAQGAWRSISWTEYGRVVDEIAAGLAAVGVRPADRVALLSWNRPEWHEADLGILAAGAISVPVYPTAAGEQVAHVVGHSGSRVCFVENREQLGRLLEHRLQMLDLEHVVLFDDSPVGSAADSGAASTRIDAEQPDFVLTFAALREIGAGQRVPDPMVKPENVATLVYTSGTTGLPKGAVITHGNAMATLRSVTKVVPLREDDRFLSFLPLSHITERSISHFGLVASGGETWFARSISTIADDLPDCRPTVFFAVPRVWEKFKETICAQVRGLPGVQGAFARRYVELADTQVTSLPRHLRIAWEGLDAIVGTRLRRKIGLDRARLLVSGAAPVHPDLLRWFAGLGLPIAEGYGQTEVALATTMNPPDAIRYGTVGPPLPGVTVRIGDDGEILVRGDNVCHGYWKDPAGTRALLDPGGWLHSGDMGAFDEAGYLRITGRKKDLIITAHGKNIAPQVLETDAKQHPLIGQAVVIGEGRRYLTALLALDAGAVMQWAHEHGRAGCSFEDLVRDPDLVAEVAAAVEAANTRHARVEHIRKWRILPQELTVAAGELTPTLKVRRAEVEHRYADLVEEMYAEPEG